MARDDSKFQKFGKNAPDPSEVYPFENKFTTKDGTREELIDGTAQDAVVEGSALDLTLGSSGPAGKPGYGPHNPNAKKAEGMGPA